MSYQNILYEKEDHVVIITLNRPEAHNALNQATAKELQTAWKAFRDDKDAFVAVITGAGEKAFSAGWDLKDAAALETLGDWDEYRQAMVHQGKCLIRITIDAWGPISKGGFPARLVDE